MLQHNKSFNYKGFSNLPNSQKRRFALLFSSPLTQSLCVSMLIAECYLMKLLSRLTIFFTSVVVLTACSANSLDQSLNIPSKVGVSEIRYVVRQTCTYEIGISYMPKVGGIKTIKEIIGPPLAVNLPAQMNILVTNSDGAKFFEENQFGGQGLGFRYGPPIKIIAGKRRLTPGTYFVRIDQTKVPESMSAFEARIFIDKPPKISCGE